MSPREFVASSPLPPLPGWATWVCGCRLFIRVKGLCGDTKCCAINCSPLVRASLFSPRKWLCRNYGLFLSSLVTLTVLRLRMVGSYLSLLDPTASSWKLSLHLMTSHLIPLCSLVTATFGRFTPLACRWSRRSYPRARRPWVRRGLPPSL